MPLHPGPLLFLVAALVTFLPGGFCGSPSHSLGYFYWQLPEPSQGLPQFFIRGYLDDQPIARFDSLTRKMEPLVPWMEEAEKEMLWPLSGSSVPTWRSYHNRTIMVEKPKVIFCLCTSAPDRNQLGGDASVGEEDWIM